MESLNKKYLIFCVLLLTLIFSGCIQQGKSQAEIDLEKEKLALEKEKLELEKSKYQTSPPATTTVPSTTRPPTSAPIDYKSLDVTTLLPTSISGLTTSDGPKLDDGIFAEAQTVRSYTSGGEVIHKTTEPSSNGAVAQYLLNINNPESGIIYAGVYRFPSPNEAITKLRSTSGRQDMVEGDIHHSKDEEAHIYSYTKEQFYYYVLASNDIDYLVLDTVIPALNGKFPERYISR